MQKCGFLIENPTLALSSTSIYPQFAYFRSLIFDYFQKYMPIFLLRGDIIKIDEMFLGAKKKGPNGRNPALIAFYSVL